MEDKVKLPAIGLMVTAGIGVLFALWGIVSAILFAELSASQAQYYPEWLQFMTAPAMQIVLNVIGIGVCGFVFWGALQMKNLESWGMAMAASILAMIPFCSPCCCIGIPIGIWAIIVLVNEDVKKAFQA